MTTFRLSLLAALACSALTAGSMYWRHRHLRAEAAALQIENSRMRMEILDRHAQQSSRAATEPAPAALAPAAAGASVVAAVAPPAATTPLVVPYYREEGTETARAALQTFAWTCDQGDADGVGRLIVFDERARAKATEFFQRLPEAARGAWMTVDQMAAELLTMSGMSAPFPSADVLERARLEEVGTDRVRLHLNGAPRDGAEFQRTAQGWRFAVTEPMVDSYIRQFREAAAGAGRLR